MNPTNFTHATHPALDRLGIPGIAAVGLLLFCLSLYLGHLAPAQDELAALQQEKAQLLTRAAETEAAEAAGAGGAAGAAASGVDAGKRSPAGAALPPLTAFPLRLQELNALAEQHGLAIDYASYTLADDAAQRRMDVSLPFKTRYSSLRAYLRALLLLENAPSLDELTLKRQQSTDPLIEANVRLSYYFSPTP